MIEKIHPVELMSSLKELESRCSECLCCQVFSVAGRLQVQGSKCLLVQGTETSS